MLRPSLDPLPILPDTRRGDGLTLSRGLFTTGNPEWHTPAVLMDALRVEFGEFYDPCPGGTTDGLVIPWRGPTVYLNPPYGRVLPLWVRKALDEMAAGRVRLLLMLLPARTDTRWFHDLIMPNALEIRFLRGRLHFNGAKGGAPFPSMLVVVRRGG